MSLQSAKMSSAPDRAGWDLARLAVQGAAWQAAEQQVPEMAGTLTLEVLAGLRRRVLEGMDRPLADAEGLASEAVQAVLRTVLGAAERAALSEAAGLARWQRLGAGPTAALESLAHVAAAGAAQRAVETAGRLSLDLLDDARAAQAQSRQRQLAPDSSAAGPVRRSWPTGRQAEPPAAAEALLRWLLPERDRDVVLADLQEELETHIRPRCSPSEARAWYWRQALGSIVPLARMRLFALLGRLWSWIPR
jgi:hypothetical protein